MAAPESPCALVVHGGAGDIPDDEVAAHQAGVRAAVLAGWAILRAGGSALDAVETAVRLMEDDPIFDAARGGFLNQAGVVELDAGLMDGSTLDLGAVAGVRQVPNPITLARRVLEHPDFSMLVGAGALAYARACGLPIVDDAALIVPRERARWEALRREALSRPAASVSTSTLGDTVGAVALDSAGRIAAATSTAGSLYKHPGRVGDSPIVGAGFYADAWGGASSTGQGEAILKVGLARLGVAALGPPAALAPPAAAAQALARLAALPGEGGLILLDTQGRPGLAFNTPRMSHAAITADGTLVAGI
ncbi:MAG TPA: isoaspartyl peptidase/L-asparaginase [Chloroflexia bacterium]|nr:isoaspartyl peptidase/L-asparaginase [Chloroflexia bacterium]